MARIAVISTDHAKLRSLLLALKEAEYELMSLGMDRHSLDVLNQADVNLVLFLWNLDNPACSSFFAALRSATRLPVFVLTSTYDEAQTVAILRAGADACIGMPVSASELSARIAAQLRRFSIWSHAQQQAPKSAEFDIPKGAVVVEGRPVELSTIERRLLDLLQEKSGVVVSRDDLCDHVWGTDGDVRYTNLSLVIYNLRKKLERNPHHPRYLLTKWGVGYYLSQEFDQKS